MGTAVLRIDRKFLENLFINGPEGYTVTQNKLPLDTTIAYAEVTISGDIIKIYLHSKEFDTPSGSYASISIPVYERIK